MSDASDNPTPNNGPATCQCIGPHTEACQDERTAQLRSTIRDMEQEIIQRERALVEMCKRAERAEAARDELRERFIKAWDDGYRAAEAEIEFEKALEAGNE